METLTRGDSVPHFSVARLDGTRAEYAGIWQQRNLLLVALPAGEAARADAEAYAAGVAARGSDWSEQEAAAIVTTDVVPGLPAPGVLVADRWGEIYAVWTAKTPGDLPALEELVEWLRYIRQECPECQGEAR